MKAFHLASSFLAISTLVLVAGGCGQNAAQAPASMPSQPGPARLSAAQVEERVKAVQANKSIPEGSKASVIAGIRAQATSK